MFGSLLIMSLPIVSLGLQDGINKLLLSIITLISLVVLSLLIHTVRTWIVIQKEEIGNIILTRISIISAVWFICIFAILGVGRD